LLKLLRENARRIEGEGLPDPLNLSKMAKKLGLTNQSRYKKLNRVREEDTIEKRKIRKNAYYYMKR